MKILMYAEYKKKKKWKSVLMQSGSADDLRHQAADGCYGKRIRSADDDVCMAGAV